jgi:hypothetical protein
MADPKAFSRRETLKLATAVSALGVGLGASLGEGEANAALVPAVQQKVSVATGDLGQLQLKLWKLVPGQSAQLLHGVDVTSLVTGGATYNLKLSSFKGSVETPITDQLVIVAQKN